MKHFTKIAMSVFLLFGISSYSNAQDAGINTITIPTAGVSLYPNIPSTPQVTLENFGSSALTNSNIDTVIFYFSYFSGSRVDLSVDYAFFSGTGVGPGQTANWTLTTPAIDWSTLGLGATSTTVSVCSRTELRSGGLSVDKNVNNDELCIVYTYAGDSNPFKYDIAMTYVRITGPTAYDTGSYIPIPTFPDQLSYDLYNAGNTDLFPGIPYTYDIVIAGGTPTTVNTATFGFVSQPGAETHQVGGSYTLPLTDGPFEICISIYPNTSDTDNSNDQNCASYIMGAPISVEEVDFKVYGDVFYNGSELRITFNELSSGMAEIDLFGSTGRTVNSYQVNVDHNKVQSIDVSDLPIGVYIVNISVNGKVMPYRFGVR